MVMLQLITPSLNVASNVGPCTVLDIVGGGALSSDIELYFVALADLPNGQTAACVCSRNFCANFIYLFNRSNINLRTKHNANICKQKFRRATKGSELPLTRTLSNKTNFKTLRMKS